jgi:NlpC/P60 family putative phage cell wall peptidase
MTTREQIVTAARGWLGTPYHHQASLKGVGCDCLGLIRGLWRELCGEEPEELPAYTRDWGNVTGSEPLLAVARRHLLPLASVDLARPGDMLVFRMQAGVAKHVGVLTDDEHFIHAVEELGVAEVTLTRWWRRRVAATFAFPDVIQTSLP